MTHRRPGARLTLAEVWTALAVLLPVLASVIGSLSTVDLAYQVRSGQVMLEQGGVLRTDPFTFTIAGQPWLNQQWGAQVLLAVGYRAAGWAGLAVARAAIIGAIFGFVLLACRPAAGHARRAAWLTLAAFLVSAPALALRPQLAGMLAFAVTGWLMVGRDVHPRRAWLAVPVAIAWSNLHGSFVLAPALVGVAWLEDIGAGRPAARRTAALLIATAAATVVTPFGPGVWGYALSLSTNSEVRSLVSEWQPTQPLSIPGALFYLSALSVVVLVAARSRAATGWRPGLPWPRLAWLAALLVIGATSERGVAWWALGAPIAIAPLAIAPTTNVPTGGAVRDKAPGPARRSLANGALVGLLVAAIAILLPGWRGGDPTFGPPGLLTDAPRSITAALRSSAPPGARVFADQGWASWFEFAVPNARLFVDSRIELFPPRLWSEYQSVVDARGDWQATLDRYRVGVVAVSAATPLAGAIVGSPRWRVVVRDAVGVVAVAGPR